MNRKRFFKKWDLAIVAALLLAAAALFLFRGGSGKRTAVIAVNGETLYEIALDDVKEPYTLTLENGVSVGVAPGEVRFLASDCEGQDCVRCGALTKTGQAAACVPNKTLIALKGAADGRAPDAVSY